MVFNLEFLNLEEGCKSLLTKERPELGLVKFIYVERYASKALDFPHF
jgi:hypothetical protein